MKQCNISRQHWISKLSSGWCGSGKIMKIRREQFTASCPRYSYKTEDKTHILECKLIWDKLAWDASDGKLKEWLERSSSCSALTDIVLTIFGNFKIQDKIKMNDYYSFEGAEKVLKKKKLGGDYF